MQNKFELCKKAVLYEGNTSCFNNHSYSLVYPEKRWVFPKIGKLFVLNKDYHTRQQKSHEKIYWCLGLNISYFSVPYYVPDTELVERTWQKKLYGCGSIKYSLDYDKNTNLMADAVYLLCMDDGSDLTEQAAMVEQAIKEFPNNVA